MLSLNPALPVMVCFWPLVSTSQANWPSVADPKAIVTSGPAEPSSADQLGRRRGWWGLLLLVGPVVAGRRADAAAGGWLIREPWPAAGQEEPPAAGPDSEQRSASVEAWLPERAVRRLSCTASQTSRKLILRLKLYDSLELSTRRVVVALNHVEVGEQELRGRRVGCALGISLERAELIGIRVDVGVESDEGRPVPAGSRRQDRVIDGGRLVISLESEEGRVPGTRARPRRWEFASEPGPPDRAPADNRPP